MNDFMQINHFYDELCTYMMIQSVYHNAYESFSINYIYTSGKGQTQRYLRRDDQTCYVERSADSVYVLF
jgi:hypothetical protein